MSSGGSPARIEELLECAVRAFGRGGYFGTSTSEVAREIGVSQPYVIQTFGTKLALFIATHRHASDKVVSVFGATPRGGFDVLTLGRAYRRLVTDEPATLAVLSHGASAGRVPEIARESRRHLAAIYHALRATGASPAEIRDFMGRGLLINAILSMDLMPHAEDVGVADLLPVVFGP